MPGIFEAVKQGAYGLFAGPNDPRTPEGTGRREGLIRAGLATIMGGAEGQPLLPALAGGALAGQEAAGQAQADFLRRQTQAQLQEFLQANGFDRESLTKTFFQTLSSGDVEGAKSIAAIIQSLPKEDTANLNISYQTVVEGGVPRRVRIATDPRTGQEVGRADVGEAPDTTPPAFYERTATLMIDGQPKLVGIERGTGRQIILGDAPPTGGSGGATSQINRNLAQAMQAAEEALAQYDAELARPIVAILGEKAREGGFIGALANGALARFSPEGQLAQAARDQWVSAAVRLLSGAQMTEVERQNYRTAYTTQANDTPDVQRQKAVARGILASLFAGEEDSPTKGDLDAILQEVGLPVPGAGGAGASSSPFGDLIPRGN